MSEAAKKIRARMHDEPPYPCMVKAEILGWAQEAEAEVKQSRANGFDYAISLVETYAAGAREAGRTCDAAKTADSILSCLRAVKKTNA